MLRFRSHSEHTLDPKGRLNVPSRFREVLRQGYGSEELIITHWNTCLRVYPVAEWEVIEEKLLTPDDDSPNFGEFVRYVIAGVNECPVDKQGRILVPPTLRTEMEIDKDVALIGMLRHFEIWNKPLWDQQVMATRQDFDSHKPGLAKRGIL